MDLASMSLVLRVIRSLAEQMTPEQLDAAAADLAEQADRAEPAEQEALTTMAGAVTEFARVRRVAEG